MAYVLIQAFKENKNERKKTNQSSGRLPCCRDVKFIGAGSLALWHAKGLPTGSFREVAVYEQDGVSEK